MLQRRLLLGTLAYTARLGHLPACRHCAPPPPAALPPLGSLSPAAPAAALRACLSSSAAMPATAAAATPASRSGAGPSKRTRSTRSRSASHEAAAAAARAAAAAIDGTPLAERVAADAAAAEAAETAAQQRAAASGAGTAAAAGGPAAGPSSPGSAQEAAAEEAEQAPQGKRKKASKPRPAAKSPSRLVLDNQKPLEFKARRIAELLGRLYPNPPIPLDHGSTFQLLCAVLLSAQTTDKKVNECTPALFALAPDAPAMAAAPLDEITACIRQLGLAPTKAKNLKAMSQILVEQHGGQVPAAMDALEALPGVGHKTASVVMCQAFGQDAFPVDTHIHRLAQRWGLTDGKNVEQTEADLKLLFPQDLWKELHLQIIFFGREKCPAQRHDPLLCPICSWAAVPPYNKAGSSPSKAGGAKNSSGSGKSSNGSGKGSGGAKNGGKAGGAGAKRTRGT